MQKDLSYNRICHAYVRAYGNITPSDQHAQAFCSAIGAELDLICLTMYAVGILSRGFIYAGHRRIYTYWERNYTHVSNRHATYL